MYNVSDSYLDAYKAPARRIIGAVVCHSSNGGVINMMPQTNLVNFVIEKTAPKGKLFGFAVSQKITIEALGVLDTVKKGDKLVPSIESADYSGEEVLLPHFFVDTVVCDKVKNRTTITGYDILHKLDSMSIGEFEFTYPVYALNYALDILEPIGGYAEFEGMNHLIREAPNLSGTETARSVLAALAEFTGTICYASSENVVKFRAMAPGDFTDVLTADDYFSLTIGETVRLSRIASGTALGDNYEYGDEGFTQVMWENPFLNMRDDVSSLVVDIGNQVRNLNTTVYTLNWRGCPAYEIGDYIILQEKDGSAQFALYFNERITYNGGLRVTSEWDASEGESIHLNPPTLGESLKQTVAKVDKVNKKIELMVGDVEESLAEMAQIKVTQNQILSTVESQNQTIDGLTQRVSQAITSDELEIAIESALGDIDTSEVTTKTGFTFNADGLNISKTGSEMSTVVTEDGLVIKRNGEATLQVNNEGVLAEDLHATTYLLIGLNSRFEDYNGGKRTGCFWIGQGGEVTE